MKNIAIFDIGTNSIKLFVYDVEEEAPVLVLKKKVENRLGGDLAGNSSNIGQENIDLTIRHIKQLLIESEKYGVTENKGFGTAVFRKKENGEIVADIVYEYTGLSVQILSQQEELEVFRKGLVSDFDWDGKIAAIDIGGGFVQFMYGSKDRIEKSYLLDTGVLSLREKFIKSDPATVAEYELIEEYISNQISNLDINLGSDVPLIHGSTSVIDFMLESGIEKSKYALSPSHPYRVNLNNLSKLYYTMRVFPRAERVKFFPSHPDYTDGCCIGMANVLLIAKKLGITYEIPSNNSIVHGFLL